MLENKSADSPLAAVALWLVAVGISALVVYNFTLDTFIEALFRPIGMVLLLVGIVAGAAQNAGVLTNDRFREVMSNRRFVFPMLVVMGIIGVSAGLLFSDSIIIYVEIVVIGFVYAAAVVRTVFVVSGAELG
jgi:hypothetical protein